MQPAGSAIYAPASWPEPLRLDELFPAKARLEVEIGCGKGRFIVARATAHPDSNFIGIDRQLKRLQRTDQKIAAAGLRNVKLIRIEAAYAFEKLLPPGSVSLLYVFFPDPWPKRKHHDRRLFSPAFMDPLHTALTPNGIIYFATDHTDYAGWTRKLFAKDARFAEISPLEPRDEERTEFESLFMGKGATISRAGFTKRP